MLRYFKSYLNIARKTGSAFGQNGLKPLIPFAVAILVLGALLTFLSYTAPMMPLVYSLF